MHWAGDTRHETHSGGVLWPMNLFQIYRMGEMCNSIHQTNAKWSSQDGLCMIVSGTSKAVTNILYPKINKLNIFRTLLVYTPNWSFLWGSTKSTYLLGRYGTMLFILSLCWRGRAQRAEMWTLSGLANSTDVGGKMLLLRVVSHPDSLDSVRLAGRRPQHVSANPHKHPDWREQGSPDLPAQPAPSHGHSKTSAFLMLTKSGFSQNFSRGKVTIKVQRWKCSRQKKSKLFYYTF